MINVPLPDGLAAQLENIAKAENRPLAELVASIIEEYLEQNVVSDEADPLDVIIGVFDDDITDLSTTVRETLNKHFQDKYARPD